MCNLSQDVLERGIKIGEKLGEARGEKRDEKRGEKRGERNTWVLSVRNVRNNLNLSVQEAMDIVQVPAALREKVALEV